MNKLKGAKCSVHQRIVKKKVSWFSHKCQSAVFNIDNKVSEGSCDTEELKIENRKQLF